MKELIKIVWFLVLVLSVQLINAGAQLDGDHVLQYTERWKDVIIIPITVEPMHSQWESLKTSLLKDRNTLGVSALSEIPSKGKRVASLEWGRAGEKESTEVNVLFVSQNSCIHYSWKWFWVEASRNSWMIAALFSSTNRQQDTCLTTNRHLADS